MKKIKKLLAILTSILALTVSLKAQETPDLLKDRADFSDYKKFEASSIYTNMQENANLIAAYEANPDSYKNEELFPVIMAYMSLRKINEGETLLLKHIEAVPNNAAALRNLASISMIKGDNVAGIEYYKKAAATGDVLGLKSLASAYVITKQTAKISELIPQLKELAKTDLEATNILLIYSLADGIKDNALAESVIANIDLNEILKNPTMDALNSSFNIYASNKDLWKGEVAIIPARVAILKNLWVLANEAVDTALEANPNNVLALKSKSVVDYRTGDILAAFNYIEKAISLGDISAYNDLVILAIESGYISKIEDNIATLEKQNLSLNSNFNLIRYGLTHNNPNLFFLGAMADGIDLLYTNEQTKIFISEGVKKFSADVRAKTVGAKLN